MRHTDKILKAEGFSPRKLRLVSLLLALTLILLPGIGRAETAPDYAQADSWGIFQYGPDQGCGRVFYLSHGLCRP